MAADISGITVSKHVVFLTNTFFINNKRHKLTVNVNVEVNPSKISSSCLTWEVEGKTNKQKSVLLTDIITANHSNQSSNQHAKEKKRANSEELPLHSSTSFQIHYAERKSSYSRVFVHKSITLRHSQSTVVHQWVVAIQGILREQGRPQSLLVFINPFGGKRKAVEIYNTKVQPLFTLAGIESHVIVTKRANHALDFIQEADIHKFDGLIAVGGDGMYCEVMSGLLLRTQKENNININKTWDELVRPSIRVGIIPAGSTDAVVYCTTGAHDPITSALLIILGSKINIDINTVHSMINGSINEQQKLLRFSTCMMGYGYFGDTLLDSEKHRWMGPARYDWSGVKSFLSGNTYDGLLKLKKDGNSQLHNPKRRAKCRVACEQCLSAFKSDCNKNTDDNSDKNAYPPGFNETSDFEVISGKFWAINSATMTCKCGRTKRGISPAAHLGDGYTDVVVVHKTSRFNYLRYLIRTAFRTSSPFDLDFVSVHRVKMFNFLPQGVIQNNVLTKTSTWNCDGEIVRESSVSVKVHCQLLSVFARGIYEYHSKPSCCLRICKKKTVPSDGCS